MTDPIITKTKDLGLGDNDDSLLFIVSDPRIPDNDPDKRSMKQSLGDVRRERMFVMSSADSPGSVNTNRVVQVDVTDGPILMTVPATAEIGDKICFYPYAGQYSVNNLTLHSDAPIGGQAADVIVSTDNLAFALVWHGGAVGWFVRPL